MTPQEAINQLDDLIKDRQSLMSSDEDYDEIYCNDIEALEIAKKVLEKQVPRRFEKYTYYPEDTLCPVCFENFTGLDCLLENGERYKFCPDCGQALDWNDESESTK